MPHPENLEREVEGSAWMGGLAGPSGCLQCTSHQQVSFCRFGFLPLSGPPSPLLHPHVSTGPPFPLFFLQT